MTRREFLSHTAAAGALATGCGSPGARTARPNIVVILADDMGFSDPGCFGGEIDTPNLNRLAGAGLRYTDFYSTARCCPTRASLLSGLYPHQTGMGWMTAANLGRPAYSGDLNRRCVTIAEALRPAGYSCYVSGKWHVVRDPHVGPAGPKDNWPLQRGFDRFFGTLNGSGNFFEPATLTRDNETIHAGEGFYYTDAISDNAARFIAEHQAAQTGQPFFLYTAYTAPHWPLHARPADIDKYRDRYSRGWEALRRERHARMIESGLVNPDWRLSEPDPEVQAWETLSSGQKEDMALRMAIYAAQVDSMDQGIGRIVRSLEETGTLDNTLLVFFSDNGACQEEIHRGAKGMDALGTKESFESYGRSWANAGNTPFRMYKHYVHEGGIASPLIVHWPERVQSGGELRDQPGHVIDVMATALDVAGASYPSEHDGRPITPLEGKSLVPSFDNQPIARDAIFWEHEANRAVRQGSWKLVSKEAAGEWELYDLAADRTETNDLAASQPDRVERMAANWQQWAQRCDVLPLDGRPWGERIKASVD